MPLIILKTAFVHRTKTGCWCVEAGVPTRVPEEVAIAARRRGLIVDDPSHPEKDNPDGRTGQPD